MIPSIAEGNGLGLDSLVRWPLGPGPLEDGWGLEDSLVPPD